METEENINESLGKGQKMVKNVFYEKSGRIAQLAINFQKFAKKHAKNNNQCLLIIIINENYFYSTWLMMSSVVWSKYAVWFDMNDWIRKMADQFFFLIASERLFKRGFFFLYKQEKRERQRGSVRFSAQKDQIQMHLSGRSAELPSIACRVCVRVWVFDLQQRPSSSIQLTFQDNHSGRKQISLTAICRFCSTLEPPSNTKRSNRLFDSRHVSTCFQNTQNYLNALGERAVFVDWWHEKMKRERRQARVLVNYY